MILSFNSNRIQSIELKEYLTYKRFWQNLGLSMNELKLMPERQVILLENIMILENKHIEKASKQK